MRRIRFGIIGTGSVVHLYLPVFKFLEEVELAALADINGERVRWLAERYRVPKVYTVARDLASDPDVDAVIIATPPNLHAEHTAMCAAARKHVLCEKPMASTTSDCLRMIEACRLSGVKLQMAHMKRFMRGNQMVRRIVDSGALGRVFMAECQWDIGVPQTDPSYRNREATGGGCLQDHGPHAFDLVRWWTGNDIRAVFAAIRLVNPNANNEDTAAVTLEHERGMVSIHHMTRVSYGREHHFDRYRLYGTDGTLVVRNDGHLPTTSMELPQIDLHLPDESSHRIEPAHPHSWNMDDAARQNNPFLNQLAAFCECIRNDTEPRVSGEDGLHSMEAVVASYVSSLRGQRIELPFREEVNLQELFRELKRRDRSTLGADYAIECRPRELPPATLLPVYAHRPPRVKERWSDEEHGFQSTPMGW